jgi:hypothetical protein
MSRVELFSIIMVEKTSKLSEKNFLLKNNVKGHKPTSV